MSLSVSYPRFTFYTKTEPIVYSNGWAITTVVERENGYCDVSVDGDHPLRRGNYRAASDCTLSGGVYKTLVNNTLAILGVRYRGIFYSNRHTRVIVFRYRGIFDSNGHTRIIIFDNSKAEKIRRE